VKFRFSDLVGRYRLEVTGELRAFIERVLVDVAPASERGAVRNEALLEATGSELQAYPDGTLVSRSGDQEFFRVMVDRSGAELDELSFEKSTGVAVRLEMRDADTVIAHQAGKLTVVFRRVAQNTDQLAL
jgi:hypothetical protein